MIVIIFVTNQMIMVEVVGGMARFLLFPCSMGDMGNACRYVRVGFLFTSSYSLSRGL